MPRSSKRTKERIRQHGVETPKGGSMEVRIAHLGAVQFEIEARQHTIVCDQPAENGGFDEGMTPPELFLASLGSCAGFYAAQYLRKHKLATEGTVVRVMADKATDPARLDNFRIVQIGRASCRE